MQHIRYPLKQLRISRMQSLTQTLKANNRHYTTSSQFKFYENRILENYAARPTTTVTLRQLTMFGKTLSAEKLIRSGTF